MFKSVYQSKTEEVNLNIDKFITLASKRYPKIINKFKDRSNLFSFFNFPKVIYSLSLRAKMALISVTKTNNPPPSYWETSLDYTF